MTPLAPMLTLAAPAALARRCSAAESRPVYFAPGFDFAARALTGLAQFVAYRL